jgi:AbrB family looped-hinge helix DNA binding protein
VTTTLSTKGQIIIPRDIRSRLGMRAGDAFQVLTSGSGDVLLKPMGRKRPSSWIRSLRGLQGLEIQRTDEPVRDIKW